MSNDPFSNLPLDLADEAGGEERKKQIALALLKQLMGGAPTPEKTRILGKQSWGSILANAGAQGLAQNSLASADKGLGEIRKRGEEQYTQGVQSLTGASDPKKAIADLMSSNHPMLRAFASAQEKGRLEQEKLAAEQKQKGAEEQGRSVREAAQRAAAAGNPQLAQEILSTGKIPTTPFTRTTIPPEEVTIPDPNNPGKVLKAWRETDPVTGKITMRPMTGGQSITVENRMAGTEKAIDLEAERKELTDRQEKAQKAQKGLASSQRVRNLLRDGATAGGFTTPVQTARKFASLFGMNIPATGFTDELKSELSRRMVADVNLLGRQPTDKDAEIMQSIVGSIDTDPRALAKLSAYLEASAIKDIDDFGSFVDKKRTNALNPNLKLYDTADTGINRNYRVSGSVQHALAVAQALVQEGLPPEAVAKYTGLKIEDIPPADADMSTMSLSGALGIGNGPLAAKPAPAARKPISEMSRAEKEALLKELSK